MLCYNVPAIAFQHLKVLVNFVPDLGKGKARPRHATFERFVLEIFIWAIKISDCSKRILGLFLC